jgi:hypothetical protein
MHHEAAHVTMDGQRDAKDDQGGNGDYDETGEAGSGCVEDELHSGALWAAGPLALLGSPYVNGPAPRCHERS